MSRVYREMPSYIDQRVLAALSDAITYFDERADADYVDAIGRAEGNDEMRLRNGLMRLREKLAGGGA